MLFVIGLGSILVGFIALAVGSVTLAPVLLVAGYLAIVPWAILTRPAPAAEGRGEGPETGAGGPGSGPLAAPPAS